MILKYLAFMLGGNMKEHMKRETEETISRRFGTCRYLIIGQVFRNRGIISGIIRKFIFRT